MADEKKPRHSFWAVELIISLFFMGGGLLLAFGGWMLFSIGFNSITLMASLPALGAGIVLLFLSQLLDVLLAIEENTRKSS